MDFLDKSGASDSVKMTRFLEGLRNWNNAAYWFDDGWPRDSIAADSLATQQRIAALERDLAAAQQDKGLAELAMRQKAERLAQCEEALAAAQAALAPQPIPEGLIPGADTLETTRRGAQYWLDGARKEPDKSMAVFLAESAINHWKNAAYAKAEALVKAETAAVAKEREACAQECARWQNPLLIREAIRARGAA